MDQNAKIKEILIICANKSCRETFNSPIFFGTVGAYETAVTWGNTAQCPKCGDETDCNKENMYYILATE